MKRNLLLNPPIGATAMVMGRETKAIVQGEVVSIRPNGLPVVRVMIGYKILRPLDLYFDVDGVSSGGGYSLISIIRSEESRGLQSKP